MAKVGNECLVVLDEEEILEWIDKVNIFMLSLSQEFVDRMENSEKYEIIDPTEIVEEKIENGVIVSSIASIEIRCFKKL